MPQDQIRPGEVSPATRQAEAEEARAAHRQDRPPTAEEEEAAVERRVDESTRRHYEEMAERGVNEPGEGRID